MFIKGEATITINKATLMQALDDWANDGGESPVDVIDILVQGEDEYDVVLVNSYERAEQQALEDEVTEGM